MKRIGIRKKAILSVTVLLIVSFALLGATLSVLNYMQERKELLDMQREIADHTAREMRWDIHQLEGLLGTAVSNYDWSLRKGVDISRFLSGMLMNEHIKRNGFIDELSFVDKAGQERGRVSRTVVYNRSDLRDLLGSDEFDFPRRTGIPYFGPVIFDNATNVPYMTISLPIPDVGSGTIETVLIGKIRLNKIWENAVERSIGKSGIIFITDDSGKVLAHPDPSIVYRNTFYKAGEGDGLRRGIGGEMSMIVTRKVEVENRTFFVYASLPLAEALSLSLKTLFVIVVFLAVFLSLSISLCLVALNRIIRPIETLADNARRISAGELVAPIQISDSDEIGDMSGAFNHMTSQLLDTIHSLENRNVLLNNILNSLTHPFYVIDASDYKVKLANPAAAFGPLTDSTTCYKLTHGRNEPCSDSDHPCVIDLIKEKKEPVVVEHLHYDKKNNPASVEIHGYPIFDGDGKVSRVIEYVFDITSRKKMEEDLNISEQMNRTITSTAKDAIIMVDDDGCILFWNPAAEEIFGYTSDEVSGRELHAIMAPEKYREDLLKGMKSFRESGPGNVSGKTIELTALRKGGTEFPIELSLSTFQMRGRWHAVGVVRDITNRKSAEKKMLESLEEKELLLQEIHHRVKNNMQVITSLLDLQLDYITGRQPADIFSDIKNRIRSMSLVHEKLYHSRDLSKVDFHDYVVSLISNLYKFYDVNPERIRLTIGIEDVFFGIDTAIPCGLIVNELITNSLKYAFPDGRAGEIELKLFRVGEGDRGEGIYSMTVRDNGIGIPAELDLKGVKTLGLYLVNTLVEHQLQGSVGLDRIAGTTFAIKFRELKYKKRI